MEWSGRKAMAMAVTSTFRVGFIGLGAMGSGMAATLVGKGFKVCGYDVYEPSMAKMREKGMSTATSCAEAASGAQVLVVMVTNSDQAESALFGPKGAMDVLPSRACIVMCSTVAAAYVRGLDHRLRGAGREWEVVDAPVSGGVVKAANGTLTIMASGSEEGLRRADSVLRAMSEKLYIIPGGVGAGSNVKMVNQLLAGVHIVASAEAMALGARCGLDTRLLYEIISNAAGNSWMFTNRVPHMLDGDFTPHSALDIFVKDLGLVLDESKGLRFPLPLAAIAHQQFLLGSAAGFGRLDDSAVVKVFEKLTGVGVAAPRSTLSSTPRSTVSPGSQSTLSSSTSDTSGSRSTRASSMSETLGSRSTLSSSISDPSGLRSTLSFSISDFPSSVLVPSTRSSQKDSQDVANLKKYPVVRKDDLLAALPSQWSDDPAVEIRHMLRSGRWPQVLVVLDDDPTGTQTVHGVNVLTDWSVETLKTELAESPPCVFISTNARALVVEKAVALTKEVCSNVARAAKAVGVQYMIILRGDSTLRGHFPQEMDAAVSVLGQMDAWIIAPFFFQGGRLTINDVHYVGEGDRMIPAGETEFAKDASFGYTASNLKEWVQEKMKGRVAAKDVFSISLEVIRKGGPAAVCKCLQNLPKGTVCIVNSATERDMVVFSAGFRRAVAAGKKFLCRTAASFVSASFGCNSIPPLTPADLGLTRSVTSSNGGLIIVGSYVQKTTSQVNELLRRLGTNLAVISVDVKLLLSNDLRIRSEEISRVAVLAESSIKSGKDTIIITSREFILGDDVSSSLAIGGMISAGLVEVMLQIKTQPRYVLAKGGITSAEIATKGLGAKKALVVGQAIAGVPLWKLRDGCRFPGIPYIVFPGNVGDAHALESLVRKWSTQLSATTASILQQARREHFAVGAFNVYNMEGVIAVIRAAEKSKSPVVLQIHPTSLERGGEALVSCCLGAAKRAAVPVSLQLDHGTNEQQIMEAMNMGFHSVMVDGSHLPFEENVALTKRIVDIAHGRGITVEAELGRLSGSEDGLTVYEYEAKLTDVEQAKRFATETGVDALAVCVGNVHGKYPTSGPKLDLSRLKALHMAFAKSGPALVMHGASGLPPPVIQECISLGITKFNVNTELREAYMQAVSNPQRELINAMDMAVAAMEAVVAQKLAMFRSVGKSCH